MAKVCAKYCENVKVVVTLHRQKVNRLFRLVVIDLGFQLFFKGKSLTGCNKGYQEIVRFSLFIDYNNLVKQHKCGSSSRVSVFVLYIGYRIFLFFVHTYLINVVALLNLIFGVATHQQPNFAVWLNSALYIVGWAFTIILKQSFLKNYISA